MVRALPLAADGVANTSSGRRVAPAPREQSEEWLSGRIYLDMSLLESKDTIPTTAPGDADDEGVMGMAA